MAHNILLMQLQRLPIAPAPYFTERCLTHNSMNSPEADRKMVCVRGASTLHAPRWCILPRIKFKKAACTSFRASPHHILRSLSHFHRHSGKRQEERTKTPYSLDINLITTKLSIAANRCVVNRFPRALSECPLNSTQCVAPGRAQVHDLTYQLESMALLEFWSTFSI